MATFFKTIWGVVVNPTEAMRDIDERRPVVQGLIVIIAVGLIGGFARYVAMGEEFAESFSIGIQTPLAGIFVPGWAIAIIVANVVAAGLLWVMSRVLGGNASFATLFAGVCFIYSIFILNSLIRLVIDPFLDFNITSRIGTLVGIAVLMWQLMLHVILVARANGFSTPRSIATVIIPEIIVWGIFSGFIFWVMITIRDRIGL